MPRHLAFLRSLLAAGGLSAVSLPASAAEYWPLVPGAHYVYRAADGTQLEVDYSAVSAGIVDRTSTSVGGCTFGEYLVEEGGGVFVGAYMRYCPPEIDPGFGAYDPPLLLLDSSLSVGNSWMGFSQSSNGPVWCVGNVVEATQVAVPAGTFDVLVVTLSRFGGLFGIPGSETRLYLDRELGPVKIDDFELVSWGGVIPIELETFGSVKALFR